MDAFFVYILNVSNKSDFTGKKIRLWKKKKNIKRGSLI